jgi:hypothetical protein
MVDPLPEVYEGLRLAAWAFDDKRGYIVARRNSSGDLVTDIGPGDREEHMGFASLDCKSGIGAEPGTEYAWGRRSQDLAVYDATEAIAESNADPYNNTVDAQWESATVPGEPTADGVPVYATWIGWSVARAAQRRSYPRGPNPEDNEAPQFSDHLWRYPGGSSAHIGIVDGALAESLCVPGAPWFWPGDDFAVTVAATLVHEDVYGDQLNYVTDNAALSAYSDAMTIGALTQFVVPPFYDLADRPPQPTVPYDYFYTFPNGVTARRYESTFPPVGWRYQMLANFQQPRYRLWNAGLRTVGGHFESVSGPQVSINNGADTAWLPVQDIL